MPPLTQRIKDLQPQNGIDFSLGLSERIKSMQEGVRVQSEALESSPVMQSARAMGKQVGEVAQPLGQAFRGAKNLAIQGVEAIGTGIDVAQGFPGRLATGFDPAVPKGFMEQVSQSVEQTTGSKGLGFTAGMIAGLISPGKGKVITSLKEMKLAELGKLEKYALTAKPTAEMTKEITGIFGGYGLKTPETPSKIKAQINLLQDASEERVAFGEFDKNLGVGQPNPLIKGILDKQPLDPTKYKTAEEFVKAQKSMYHATPSENLKSIESGGLKESSVGTQGKGYYFGFNEANAKSFVTDRLGKSNPNASVVEFKLSPNAKLLDTNYFNKSSDPLVQKIQALTQKLRDSGNLAYPDKANDAIRKLVLDNGYDGLSNGGSPSVIYNKNAFQTKSQLTDIWNKAQTKIDPLIQEAKQAVAKGISKEEWIKGQGTPVFRGGEAGFAPSERGAFKDVGFSVSRDIKTAKEYGKVSEGFISPDAKIKQLGRVMEDIDSKIAKAKKEGFDAIEFSSFDSVGKETSEILILNPKVVKTPSQLSSLYDEATKATPKTGALSAQEAVARGVSKEEWIKGQGGMAQIKTLVGTAGALAGGSAVGALALSKIYGIPTEWTKNLTDEVKKSFPFDEEALKTLGDMGNVRQIDLPGGGKGKYLPRGGEIFNLARALGLPEKVAGKIADLGISQKFDKANIQIEKDLKEPVQKILAHEMLHHIYNKKNFRFKDQRFAEDWYDSWNKLIEQDPEKYYMLGEIDDRMEQSGYDMNNPVSVADERYSFLGQEAIDNGIGAIPPELHRFYVGVIKMQRQSQ